VHQPGAPGLRDQAARSVQRIFFVAQGFVVEARHPYV